MMEQLFDIVGFVGSVASIIGLFISLHDNKR